MLRLGGYIFALLEFAIANKFALVTVVIQNSSPEFQVLLNVPVECLSLRQLACDFASLALSNAEDCLPVIS